MGKRTMTAVEVFRSCRVCAKDPSARHSNPIVELCYCPHRRVGILTVVGQAGAYVERQCSPGRFAALVAHVTFAEAVKATCDPC
jgi:hypothetical protein